MRLLFVSAFRNLGRQPRRTLISLIAIAVAMAALILFESFIQGVKSTFRFNIIHSQFGHYKIFAKGYLENKGNDPYAYPIKDFPRIKDAITKKVGPLAFISQRQDFYGLLMHGERSVGGRGIGIDAATEKGFLVANKAVAGAHLADCSTESIYLGAGLAKQLSAKVGDMVTAMVTTASGSINAIDLTTCGIFRTGISELDDSIFYLDRLKAQNLIRVADSSEILLAFSDDDEMKFRGPLQDLIRSEFPNLQVYHWHDLLGDYFDNSMQWLESQFRVFRAIILLIAVLSITNVFMMGLLERTGEFGTLRALGTQRYEIIWLVLTESLLQAFIGAILGTGISFLAIAIFLRQGITMPPPPNMSESFHVNFAVPWETIPFTLLACVVVAGAAGILPAIKVARINIVQALGRNI